MALNPETLPHAWINRLGFLLRKDLADRFRAAGHKISAEEWAVLLFLWQRDGRRPSELADLTIRDRTTMTRLLDGMARKGLISRQPDQKDRRRISVRLSARGRDLRAVLVPIAKGLIAQSLHGIGITEMETTVSVLRRMMGNMQNEKE
jgi:DNA-binding MarR family transcriptional regulator